ncbi:unnamed protein product [Caenorhabditis auriculariae]|uniref:Uncharacterized protein n=1 Tax=Caenorhabditis auriculariae TaxID=2777116 RepID=A0A8S1HDB5_9PELO|nr:unnamed protein product [Caenorhabditis auriculariae]
MGLNGTKKNGLFSTLEASGLANWHYIPSMGTGLPKSVFQGALFSRHKENTAVCSETYSLCGNLSTATLRGYNEQLGLLAWRQTFSLMGPKC